MVLWAVREAVSTVTLNPDAGNLPGGAVLQQLTDGLGGWALIMALVGLVIGAAAWALGAHSQNYHQSFNGRKTVLVSGARRAADRRRTGDRQLLLPRRAGGALTVLEAFALCPGDLPLVGTAVQRPVLPARGRQRRRAGRRGDLLRGGTVGGVGRGVVDRAGGTGHVGHDVGRPRRGMVRRPRSRHGEPGGRGGPAHGVLCRDPGHLPPERVDAPAHLSRAPAPCSCCSPVWPSTLVRMALALTDAMSATVLSSAGVDTTNLLTGLFKSLIPVAVTASPIPGLRRLSRQPRRGDGGAGAVAGAGGARCGGVGGGALPAPWRWRRSCGRRWRTGADGWPTPSSPSCCRSSWWRRCCRSPPVRSPGAWGRRRAGTAEASPRW